jgi:hypothetical protein
VINLEEKIAIHCKSKEEWQAVEDEMFSLGNSWPSNGSARYQASYPYMFVGEYYGLQKGTESYLKEKGYKIITAEDYLKEGFKVGDRVECVEGSKYITEGGIYTVIGENELGNIRIKGIPERGYFPERFKLANNQTKTIKQEEVEMNIGKSFIKVFKEDAELAANMSERFGSQYGETERDLLALKRDKKELLAIVKAEEDAEKEA